MFRGLKTAINGACKYAACHALINLYFGRFCHKVFSHYHQRSAGIIFVIILYHRIIPIESSHLFFSKALPAHTWYFYMTVLYERSEAYRPHFFGSILAAKNRIAHIRRRIKIIKHCEPQRSYKTV